MSPNGGRLSPPTPLPTMWPRRGCSKPLTQHITAHKSESTRAATLTITSSRRRSEAMMFVRLLEQTFAPSAVARFSVAVRPTPDSSAHVLVCTFLCARLAGPLAFCARGAFVPWSLSSHPRYGKRPFLRRVRLHALIAPPIYVPKQVLIDWPTGARARARLVRLRKGE
jgi:hypothetical protein